MAWGGLEFIRRLSGSWVVPDGEGLAFGHTPAIQLPTCDATRNGEHRWVRGEGGVADREVVCEKNAADSYAWRDKGHAYLEAEYAGGGGGGDDTFTKSFLLGGM